MAYYRTSKIRYSKLTLPGRVATLAWIGFLVWVMFNVGNELFPLLANAELSAEVADMSSTAAWWFKGFLGFGVVVFIPIFLGMMILGLAVNIVIWVVTGGSRGADITDAIFEILYLMFVFPIQWAFGNWRKQSPRSQDR